LIDGYSADAVTPRWNLLSASLTVCVATSRLAEATLSASEVSSGSQNTAHHRESRPEKSIGAGFASAMAGSGFPKNEAAGSIGSGGMKSGPTETQPQKAGNVNAATNRLPLRIIGAAGELLMRRATAAPFHIGKKKA
jgi:hypothetical protein